MNLENLGRKMSVFWLEIPGYAPTEGFYILAYSIIIQVQYNSVVELVCMYCVCVCRWMCTRSGIARVWQSVALATPTFL